MARSEGFVQYIVEEVMRDIPGISSRGMFGGYGVYKDGVIFGLIVDDQLYFKVDDTNRADFETLGSSQFTYEMKGKPRSMDYYVGPEEIMENSDELMMWVNRSVEVSRNSKKKKS